ncbi:MAG TPA: RHS repeat domain-containing protein [Puia sp.]|nr:RHS repeat domain-containing protein [Puia sp.]
MKFLIGFLFPLLLSGAANAQYYYKDIISTRLNTAKWRAFKAAGVRSVRLTSTEGDGRPTEGFEVEQTINADFSGMTTHSRTNGSIETWTFNTYSPQGLLTSVTDTSDTYQSVSDYQYDTSGRLLSITNTSTETDNHVKAVETHIWEYPSATSAIPTGMLKIQNGVDTTYVRFLPDEKGNLGEERARRNNEALPAIYYYYDDHSRLTDIVRYNLRAQRLLPDNIFEYDEEGRLKSLIAVQVGASSYQKWIYAYNEKGLRTKETCYSKDGQLVGIVQYEYNYK